MAWRPPKFTVNASPAGSATDVTAPKPLGVPVGTTFATDVAAPNFGDYVPQQFAGMPSNAPGAGNGFTYEAPPRYYEGNEYDPLKLSPADRIRLQDDLVRAGLLVGSYRQGEWDDKSIAAYQSLLISANRNNLDWQSQLGQYIEHPLEDEKAKRAPLVVRLSNADDIRNLARHTGAALYGGSIPDSTVEAIVSAVHQSERAEYEAAYAAGNPEGPGGVVMGARDPEAVAEEKIRESHPNEVAATQFSAMFDDIMGAMTTNTSGYDLRG